MVLVHGIQGGIAVSGDINFMAHVAQVAVDNTGIDFAVLGQQYAVLPAGLLWFHDVIDVFKQLRQCGCEKLLGERFQYGRLYVLHATGVGTFDVMQVGGINDRGLAVGLIADAMDKFARVCVLQ